ncbi:MAG: hypothetical protein Q9210_001533 [Variospora velana]
MSRQRKMQISAIKLYTHHDITYYPRFTGLWTHPEMVSGILVACLPVSPKFFQKLQQTRFFSQLGSSLQSLLRFTSNDSKRSTKGQSASHQIPPQRASWSKGYEMLPDEQRSNGGQSVGDDGKSVVQSFRSHQPPQTRPHLVQTVDVDARSVSRRGSDGDCGDEPQNIWQGSSSYNVSVMVWRLR